MYETVQSRNQQGARNEQQIRYCDSKMYMVPNAAMLDDESQYEELQISTRPPVANKKKPVVVPPTSQSVDSVTRQNTLTSTAGNNTEIKGTQKRRGSGCIVIGMLFTVLAVIIIVTLAVGALGFRGSSRAQIALDALEEDTQNHTSYLLDEIRALNSQLVQLHADSQSNISHLLNQLAHQHQEMTSISRFLISKLQTITTSVSQLSHSAYQVSTSVSQLSTSARSVSNSVYSVSSSVSRQSRSMSTSLSRLSTSVYSLSSSVSLHQYSSHYNISTSISRLSTSVSQLSSSFVSRCTTSC